MTDLWRGSLAVVAAAFLGAGVACAMVLWWAGVLPTFSPSQASATYCNVLKVPVYGQVVTIRPDTPLTPAPEEGDPALPYSPDTTYAVSTEIEDMLRSATGDPSIKGLLVDIDSYGGSPVAGSEIASAIRKFGGPSAAVIHDAGISAGYLVASAANIVFATEESSVGSIGVTSSYTDQSEKDKKDGITFHQLSSGPYKDTFNLDKPLTESERALIMRDVNISHDNFVRRVAEYREQPLEKIAALADGSTLMGKAALEAGLIDSIGGTDEALGFLEQAIGEPVEVCW